MGNGFIRDFDCEMKKRILNDTNRPLFERLKDDIYNGSVFPAIRDNTLDFYFAGGCLFSFTGSSFKRNRAYMKYTPGHSDDYKNFKGYATESTFIKDNLIQGSFLDNYDQFKLQNSEKFNKKNNDGKNDDGTERKLLSDLYKCSFCDFCKSKCEEEEKRKCKYKKTSVVVLDIEVRVNEMLDKKLNQKKCDLVLLNTKTKKIMFVEGKVFSDGRMFCYASGISSEKPEVILQVNSYSKLLNEFGDKKILPEYQRYVRIYNDLFSTKFPEPTAIDKKAKLLVYDTAEISQAWININFKENRGLNKLSISDCEKSKSNITKELLNNNVYWIQKYIRPSLDIIWKELNS